MTEKTIRGTLAGDKADCLVKCTTIYQYWCVDKYGREYLTDKTDNPEILRLDGRMLELNKCPKIFARLNWNHELPLISGKFCAGGTR